MALRASIASVAVLSASLVGCASSLGHVDRGAGAVSSCGVRRADAETPSGESAPQGACDARISTWGSEVEMAEGRASRGGPLAALEPDAELLHCERLPLVEPLESDPWLNRNTPRTACSATC